MKNRSIGRILMLAMLVVAVSAAMFSVSAATSVNAPTLKSVTKTSTTMNVEWYTVKNADGYEIQYATNGDYKDAKIAKASKKAVKRKISNLKKNTGYYVRVRSYITGKEGKIYSRWNSGCRIIVWNKNWKYAKNSSAHSSAAVLYYASPSKRKDITVALNPGHGSKSSVCSKKNLCHPDGTKKVTGGSTGKGAKYAAADNAGASKEAGIMLSLAKKTKRQLLNAGYDVLMLRQTSGVNLDVIGRTVMANNNADCHIALHYDGTTSNKGAFYCSVPNVKSYRSMYPVSKNYKKHNLLGKSLIAGLKGKKVKIFSDGSMPIDLMQTSFSTIPSTDLEVGDRKTGYSSAKLDRMAKGIVAGVNRFY